MQYSVCIGNKTPAFPCELQGMARKKKVASRTYNSINLIKQCSCCLLSATNNAFSLAVLLLLGSGGCAVFISPKCAGTARFLRVRKHFKRPQTATATKKVFKQKFIMIFRKNCKYLRIDWAAIDKLNKLLK